MHALDSAGHRSAVALTCVLCLVLAGCRSDSRGYEALIEAGKASMSRGEADRALDAFLQAQRMRPERKEPYVYIGGLCESRGTPRDGIPILREGVARDDENRKTYHFLVAVLLEMADERGEAEQNYRECLRLDAGFAPAWANLGQFLFTSGRNAEALDLLGRAVERFPGDDRIRLQYAEILMRDGNLDEAEALARVIVEGHDPPLGSHYLMGLVDLERDRADDARLHLERAAERDPGNLRTWYQLANACDRVGDDAGRDRALRRFDPLLRGAVGAESP